MGSSPIPRTISLQYSLTSRFRRKEKVEAEKEIQFVGGGGTDFLRRKTTAVPRTTIVAMTPTIMITPMYCGLLGVEDGVDMYAVSTGSCSIL